MYDLVSSFAHFLPPGIRDLPWRAHPLDGKLLLSVRLRFGEVAERNHEEMFNTPWRDYNDARSFEYSTVSGKVWRDGERLRFEGLNFWHIGYGLPGLIAYLRDKGCTNIQYKLTGKNAMDIWQNHS